jgi:succinate dehydrogenase/fumarate reductase flavoprotein subunit
MAALHARQKGASVVLVEKSAVQRSGSAASGLDHARGVYPVEGAGTLDDFAEAFMRQSEGMGSRKLLRIIGEEMYERMLFLEKWGLRIRDGQGNLLVRPGVGTRQSFILSFEGEDFKKRLDQALRENGVTIINRTMPTRLLMDGGRPVGATLVNLRSGEFLTVRCKAVVLAAGGATRIYPSVTGLPYNTVGCPYNTGDAYALGYLAGAELVNFEFTMTMVTLKNYSVPGYAGSIGVGARLVNALGERIMERYEPEMLEQAPRHKVCLAVHREILEGRGPCYYDFRHLSEERLQFYRRGLSNERALILRYFDEKGLDLRRDLVEVELGELATHNGGVTGLLIDEEGATSVPGLYAAGDCAGGVGYCAGSNAIVFGWRAGGAAATLAQGLAQGPWPEELVGEERRRALAPLQREEGFTGQELEAKLQRTMGDYVGLLRNEVGLRTGVDRLVNLKNYLPDLVACSPQDLQAALEAQNLLLVGEMVGRAALARSESRWYHQRVDHPQQDNARWRRFLVIRQEDGEMRLSTRELPE